mgnify:CR=1 FL=1
MTGLEDAIARANLDIYLNRSKWGIVSFPGKDGYAAPFACGLVRGSRPSRMATLESDDMRRRLFGQKRGNRGVGQQGRGLSLPISHPGAAEHILNLMPQLESISGIKLASDCRWASRRCGVVHWNTGVGWFFRSESFRDIIG